MGRSEVIMPDCHRGDTAAGKENVHKFPESILGSSDLICTPRPQIVWSGGSVCSSHFSTQNDRGETIKENCVFCLFVDQSVTW